MQENYLKEELYSLVQKDRTIFEFIQDGSLDGMWYWDLENMEQEWMSPRFWTTLGYDPQEKKHLASEWQDIINQEDLALAFENAKKHFQDPSHPYDQIVRYKHKNGSTVWIRCRGMAIRDAQGKPIRMIGAHNDVTEIMLLKEQAQEHEKLLEQQVAKGIEKIRQQDNIISQKSQLASMGEMIGAIAHQWRQPLNELTIRIQKLKYDYEDEKIDAAFLHTFIEKNKQTIEFMSRTIDDFRNFFRVDKEKKLFSIKEAIEQVLNIQKAQLGNHHIDVTLEGDDFNVLGFKRELQQVIMNILANAKDAFVLHAMKSGKIDISLQENRVTVTDNGGGIDPEILDKIFDPYFTTKAEGVGSGMGLYMSKTIIEENMQGSIKASNTQDGAKIEIQLHR